MLLQAPLFEKSEVLVIRHNLIGKRNQSKGQIVNENSKPKLCNYGKGKLKIKNHIFSDFKAWPNVLCIHCSVQIVVTLNFITKALERLKNCLVFIHTPDNFIMTVICAIISYVLLPPVDSHHSTLKMDIHCEVTGTEG